MEDTPLLSRDMITRVFTGFVLTFIHAMWGYILYLAVASMSYSYSPIGTNHSGFFVGLIFFVGLTSPVLFYFILLWGLRKKTVADVWRIFFNAEIPVFLFSWLFAMMAYQGLPGLFLYACLIVGVVGYCLYHLSSEETQEKYSTFLNVSSLLGSGVMTYAFIIWSFFFVAIMSQVGTIIVNIIQSLGYIINSYYFTEAFWAILYMVFVIIFFLSPLYLIGSYWRFLSLRNISLSISKSEKVNQFVMRLLTFIGIFVIASLLNPSLYAPFHSPLELKSKSDYEAVYNTKDMTQLFVSTYSREIGYLGGKNSKIGYTLFCPSYNYYYTNEDSGSSGSTVDDQRCGLVNKAMVFLFTPFYYQREYAVGSSYYVSKILEHAYDGKIPSTIDPQKIQSELSKLTPSNGSYYETPAMPSDAMYKMSPSPALKNVILRTISVNSLVSAKQGIQQSTIHLEFHNLTMAVQESKLLMHLPAGAVVTDLKLGKSLEMTGIIAPKGAADQVYSASIVRRVDPAVITQLGPSTYSLKVYPVFADSTVSDMQKVEITYIAPITQNYEIPTILSESNTDIDYKSVVSGKVTVATAVAIAPVSETAAVTTPVADSSSWGKGYSFTWSFDRFASYLNTDHRITLGQQIQPYCSEPVRASKKAVIYVDNSLSAKKYKADYESLIKGVVAAYDTVSVIEFNETAVSDRISVTKDTVSSYTSGLTFWGNSDVNRYQQFLTVAHDDEDVYLVTDNDTYATGTVSSTQDYDYSKVQGKLFVAYAGGYKDLSEKVRYAVAAKGGDMLSISRVLDHISATCNSAASTTSPFQSMQNIFKLARENNKKMLLVSDHDSFVEQGRKMYVVAGRNNFVDILNSLIALETETQMQQLRTEIEKDQAFDSNTSGGWIVRNSTGNWSPSATVTNGFFDLSMNKAGYALSETDGSSNSNSGSRGITSVAGAVFAIAGVIIVTVMFVGVPKKSGEIAKEGVKKEAKK